MATAKEKREAREAEAKARAAVEANAAGKPSSEQIEALNKEATLHPDKVPSAHGAPIEKSVAGAKVLVGFKVGIAYFDLQLSKLEEVDEQTQTGIRRVKMPVRYGPVVRLRGTAYPRGQVPDGYPERPEVIHGAAMNREVARDFMVEWMRLNVLNPMVTNKMIFVAENEADFRALAREYAGLASGFEPMDPKSGADPRMPRPTNKDVGKLEGGKPAVA